MLESVLLSDYSESDRHAAEQYFGGCAYCGDPAIERYDHVVPVSKHGDFVSKNVVPACQPCDDSKSGRDYKEWMRNGDTRRSLRGRGRTEAFIESRIRLIERHAMGYRPKSLQQLFGRHLTRYESLLLKMEELANEARQLIQDVRRERDTA